MTTKTIRILEQEFEMVPVDLMRPHPDNPNRGDMDSLGESIDENGFFGAVTLRRHPDEEGAYQIIGGEHRWRFACRNGMPELPALIQLDVDDVQAIRMVIADNEVGRRGYNDQDALDRAVETIGSIRGTGLDPKLSDVLDRAGEAHDAEDAAEAEVENAKDPERSDEASSGALDEEDGSEGPYVDDSDDDPGFAQEWGILVTAESELQQQEIFEQLAKVYGVSSLRVVSI